MINDSMIGSRFYSIEIVATEDEAENLKRFDAEWQSLRQRMFGPMADAHISDEVALQSLSKSAALLSDQS